MLIAWDNKADAAALTPGSEIATLPAVNVQNPHVAKKWHTAAGVKSTSLVLDMLSAVACDVLALLGVNLTSAGTVQIRASNIDPTVLASLLLDTGALACGVKAGYGAIYKAFASTTARYWRLDIADATLPDNLQIGRLVLAPSWSTSLPQLFDWGVQVIDESERAQSYGGQMHVDIKPQRRRLDFVLDFMDEAEMYGNGFALARANGIAKDVLAIPDINGAYLSEQAVWGLCEAQQPLVHRLPQIYRQKFSIVERL